MAKIETLIDHDHNLAMHTIRGQVTGEEIARKINDHKHHLRCYPETIMR
jgi:hypothetical protein